MANDRFSFEGIEPIEAEVRRLAVSGDAAYIVLQDRTERTQNETVGRFDLDDASAAPFLAEVEGDAPDDPYVDEPDEADEDEPEPEPMGLDPEERVHAIAGAACAWIRQRARQNSVGETSRRFRVRVYGPKGHHLIFSGQFVCRHEDAQVEADAPPIPMPPPSFEAASGHASVKAIKALGDGYAQFAQLLIASMSQLQGINNGVLSRSHRQAEESRDQVDKLVAAMIEHRWKEAVHESDAHDRSLTEARRAEVVKEGLEQLGKIANAMIIQKGIAPELVDVVNTIGQSPDLLAALQDPQVRELMKNPAHLADLAKLLRHAAQTAKPSNATPNPASAA